MNPYIEILRPGNALMGAISIILVALIDKTISIPVILAMIAVFFETSAGNVINDYFDYKIDLINKPERPIPSGRISLKNGRNYGYSLFAAGTVCGFLISYITNNWIPFGIVLFADIILYLYAYTLKTTPLIGNLTVGFMTGFGFVFGGFSINNPNIIITSLFLGFFAFVMTTAREIVKDIEDIEGDKTDGAKTLPILIGEKKPAILAAILIIIDSALCPLLYYYHIFGILYLVVIAFAVMLFIYSAILILKSQKREIAAKVSKNLKIGMLIAFVAFIFGSLI
ncbi:geranylgeranylglycerol-phosphate geranylgeranyltransferase [Methanobrevibacter gottschalkii]|uniref:Digeranylgeranylglyceryl phosphate synthase n=2 Tax=Methanobrevibacter gottschalkii TaxID=190974 RepID=A0A3N5C397_9EURY|nr:MULTISPECIES: UbiA family prenyltransferase [Methanobrevibacter]MCQ2971213.1 UbiA family prenyltransferase [archaeon]OEC97574.1 geranylgeranylglycerol-phosphate geranylgeranyltransferase [Methanobrevibacter sp. A27]RPF52545.1 geranylgeranylglycerol-phosphate geranylgeranyltransferase [Methanobrevibacter gottschalkii DSM 11977]SEL19188.1 geranylgeranylglycerol-phosphate geranylgeranyltransferase [Methanobrevibacter gottschalkii]